MRQEHLIKGKYFECDCRRCMDPAELGTHLSSIRCQSCTLGFLMRLNNNTTAWNCLNCNATKLNEDIQLMLCECRREAQQIGQNVEHIEAFIEKYTKLLHPNHYLLIEIKQKLAAIIRHMIATTTYDDGGTNKCISSGSKKSTDQRSSMECLYKRKIQLCKDFVPLLDVLQPGISRLKAIVLYEQFGPLVQLTKLYHQQKIICDTECMVNIYIYTIIKL